MAPAPRYAGGRGGTRLRGSGRVARAGRGRSVRAGPVTAVRVRAVDDAHGRNQPVASPANAGDVTRSGRLVAQRVPHELHALAHRLGADDEAGPDTPHQLVR